jgi:DsbC/DsbD-like thiol-disulfide interchange protein
VDLNTMNGPSTLCVVALTATIAWQGPSKAIETRHARIATEATVAPGGKLSLFVDVTPKPTMHVYAPGQKEYIPVSLALEPNPALKTSPARFPKAETLVLPAINETQLVYSKPFRIVQDVTVARADGSKPGDTLTLKGTLRYQACDDAICYLPINVPLTWSIAVK